MTSASGLLRTKLHRPQVTEDFVSRERLLDRLNRQAQRPLTLVTAPAGYGKSTLVSSWREASNSPTAWLSLDEDDNDLSRFLAYFVAAVESVFSGACPETASLLEARTRPLPTVLIQTLLNEVDQISAPFALVLDDYNRIHEPEIHALVTELLRHPPRPLHLVLVTRRDPPLPLNVLRARSSVVEVRAQDLRFSAAETATFLHKVFRQQVDGDTAALLTHRTEGWVTGLRLATLSLDHRDDIAKLLEHLPEDTRHVTDYLLSEVLDHLPAGVQDFLLKTSVLDRLYGPLCDAVAELDEPECNGQAYLAWLQQQNLFTIPLDDRYRWYRYHHLFQHLLRHQLNAKMAGYIPALHSRASAWFAENGFVDEALHHALASGDGLAAARLVEENLHAPLNEDKWYVLQRWIDQIPGYLVEKRPALLLAGAWIATFRGILWVLPEILNAVEQSLQTKEIEQSLQGEKAFFDGVFAFWAGQIDHSRELFHRAVKLIPVAHVGARNEAEIYFAVASQMTGDGEAVIKTYLKELYQEKTHELRQTRLLAAILFVHLLRGELIEAEQITTRLARIAAETSNRYVSVWVSYLQGYIHYAWNNLETARQHFTQALQEKHLLAIQSPIDNYAGLILAYQARGQHGVASDTVQQLLEFVQQSTTPRFVGLARSVQARLSLVQGDLESAQRWLVAADPSSDTGTVLFWLELPRITECRVLIAQGTKASLSEAAEKLRGHLSFSEKNHNTSQSIGILCLLAVAYLKQENSDAALNALKRAVMLARPGGWIRPFVDAGTELTGPLQRLGHEGLAPQFVQQILDGYPQSGLQAGDLHIMDGESKDPQPLPGKVGVIGTGDDLVETLTHRESDVLALLALRLTNKEIAAELSVSVATVKKHSANIYQKLNVRNRRQAVSRAVAAGILPPQ